MSYLITAATDFELQAFTRAWGHGRPVIQLVTGIGPVETAVSLCRKLGHHAGELRGVLNLGVAGAYVENGSTTRAGMLDICLAEREVLGDLGICLETGFERFSASELKVKAGFALDKTLLAGARTALERAGISCRVGIFVTVNCASGTRQRGDLLGREFQGLCENMEGAAVARACESFDLPCLEVRCISNLVVDRDPARWKLHQACELAGKAAAVILADLM